VLGTIVLRRDVPAVGFQVVSQRSLAMLFEVGIQQTDLLKPGVSEHLGEHLLRCFLVRAELDPLDLAAWQASLAEITVGEPQVHADNPRRALAHPLTISGAVDPLAVHHQAVVESMDAKNLHDVSLLRTAGQRFPVLRSGPASTAKGFGDSIRG